MLLFHSFYLVSAFLHSTYPFSRDSHQTSMDLIIMSLRFLHLQPWSVSFTSEQYIHLPARMSLLINTLKNEHYCSFKPSKLSNHLCFSSHQIAPLFKPETEVCPLIPFPFFLYLNSISVFFFFCLPVVVSFLHPINITVIMIINICICTLCQATCYLLYV